jgi:hypothetical protein
MPRYIADVALSAVLVCACEEAPLAPVSQLRAPTSATHQNVACIGCGLERLTLSATILSVLKSTDVGVPGPPSGAPPEWGTGLFSCESPQIGDDWEGTAVSDVGGGSAGTWSGHGPYLLAMNMGANNGPFEVEGQVELADGTRRVGFFVTEWSPTARSCSITNGVMRIDIDAPGGYAVSGVDANGNNVSGGGKGFVKGYIEIAPDMTVISSSFSMRLLSLRDPAKVVITPSEATHEVGSSHTFTAKVTDFGLGLSGTELPVAGTKLVFAITGSVTTDRQCVSDGNGECTVSYVGPASSGTDQIAAFADINGDGIASLGEPTTSASVVWSFRTPTATLVAPTSVNEGAYATISLTTPSNNDVRYAFDCGTGYGAIGTTTSANCLAEDNGTLNVKAKVINATDDAVFTEYPAQITVNNLPPTATLINSGAVDEGSSIHLELSNPHDVPADIGTLRYAFDCGAGFGQPGLVNSANCSTTDNLAQQVRGRIVDKDGGSTDYAAVVTVMNVPPVVTAITLPTGPVPIGTLVTISARFSDVGTADVHTALFDLDLGGATAAAGINEASGSGSASASVSYAAAGVYTISVTVSDDDGGRGSRSSALDVPAYLVVYDPASGFVTGGGWIWSPTGAYTPDPNATGKATFGFVSKYLKGAATPTGSSEFQFRAGDLDFSSTSYSWLVIGGSTAKYKGVGTINGRAGYGFMLTAVDGTTSGNADSFRIKIWDITNGTIVYDNKLGASDDSDAATLIGGGSIVIHK